MYPIGLFEAILALYGSYKLLDEFVFISKKKIEYIELTDYQYQQVRNIISNTENSNEVCPPYTENVQNVQNIENVQNVENVENVENDVENTENDVENETEPLLIRQNIHDELQNKLAAPFH